MNPSVLFVGLRNGALKAARELGLDVRALYDQAPTAETFERLTAHRQVSFAERRSVAAAARELAADLAIAAVVGVSEKSVLPAAWVREALRAAPGGAHASLPGHDVATAVRVTDKIAMKHAIAAAGVPCTSWLVVEPASDPEALARELGLPLVFKRAVSSGSRGLIVAREPRAIPAALATCDLAERFVEGIEMSVESFVQDGRVRFTNFTEYYLPAHANILPAELSDADTAAVLELNQAAIRALGIERGMTHLELFRTPAGPLFGELAARAPGGRIMQLLERAWRFSPWRALLELELGRTPEFPARPMRMAGVWVLHPGAGRVRSVGDLEAVRGVPGIRRAVCRVASGNLVRPREGTGQDVGFLQAEGPDRATVVAALEGALRALDLQMED